jgi:hypothetical protein
METTDEALVDRGAATGLPTRLLARVIAFVLEAGAAFRTSMLFVGRLAGSIVRWMGRHVVLAVALTGLLMRTTIRVLGVAIAAASRAAYSVRVAYYRARAATAPRAPLTTTPPPAGESRRAEAAFTVAVSQNPYLPPGGRQVAAIIEVTSSTAVGSDGEPERAEVFLLDCSGSMGRPWSKLQAARNATSAALDALPDGTWFAIVRGDHRAETTYPPNGGLALLSPESRAEAQQALGRLWAEGGTAMGQWLSLARDLLSTRPAAIAHALLVTDGRNESERREELHAAFDACTGVFQCDCRGVGTEWDVDELGAIASRLLGTVDVVPEPIELVEHFQLLAEKAAARRVDRVQLEVQVPRQATIRSVHQVSPELDDLSARRFTVDERTTRYPLGAWSSEVRHYLLGLDVRPHEVGRELLAAQVRVLVDGATAAHTRVLAVWTDDETRSAPVDPAVAHYLEQVALVEHVRRGLLARRDADDQVAATELGRAARIAASSGHDESLRLIANVVDLDSARTGVIKLRADIDVADELALATRSTRTLRRSRQDDGDAIEP